MNTETQSTIKAATEDLLKAMGIRATITVSDQEDEAYRIQIDTEDTGILIGFHGETLDALQLILNKILYKKLGDWVRVSVGVGDYLDKREEQLKALADRAVEKVRATQKPESLPFLDAKERRFIHVYLQGVTGIKTESVGEDEERRLVVFPTHE